MEENEEVEEEMEGTEDEVEVETTDEAEEDAAFEAGFSGDAIAPSEVDQDEDAIEGPADVEEEEVVEEMLKPHKHKDLGGFSTTSSSEKFANHCVS